MLYPVKCPDCGEDNKPRLLLDFQGLRLCDTCYWKGNSVRTDIILKTGEQDTEQNDPQTLCDTCCGDSREVLTVGILFPGRCENCKLVWPAHKLRRVIKCQVTQSESHEQ